MLGSGHLTGYAVTTALEDQVVASLRNLARPRVFSAKYGVGRDKPVLLFAMGDGNHSLATAKAVWEKMKVEVGMNHPARYALVEIENVHDEGLEFEPIHRVLFGLKTDIFASLNGYFGAKFNYNAVANAGEMIKLVDHSHGRKQAIGLVGEEKQFGVVEIDDPPSNLPVGTLQAFLDPFMKEGGADKIDYVHGRRGGLQIGRSTGQCRLLRPRHGQVRPVQDGHPGWCSAA